MQALRVPSEQVRRIVVLRALMLGDMLCAVPALRALRAAYPAAEVAFVGLPWARWLVGRLGLADVCFDFPGHPALPEQPPRPGLDALVATLARRRFDLALQLHGNGIVTTPLVERFGARRTAGFAPPGAVPRDPALALPWRGQGHEIERCLALTDHLGIPRRGLGLAFPLRRADVAAARRIAGTGAYAIVHPGAQLPSRRWPAARFAAVADALADRGLRVLVTGTAAEAPIGAALRAGMRRRADDLVGRTGLGTLGALVAGARLVVCNDTGVSHVAAAFGTPSVVLACGSDVARWAPLDGARHRVLWVPVPCRPCAFVQCPTGHECAQAIEPAAAIDAANSLLSQAWPSDCASSPGTSTATTCTT